MTPVTCQNSLPFTPSGPVYLCAPSVVTRLRVVSPTGRRCEVRRGMQRESMTPQEVIAGRCGAVLGRQTVLKDDHFPGCQNKKLTPLIDGAPNFRQVAGLPVYGVAIPTVTGLRNVLDAVGGKTRKALWHSMREEPLVYLNGQPYVLREIERPFSNLELTGITRERVEQMEVRLREDVLAEAEQYHGRVLVSKELDDGQVIDSWEPVHTVQTPAEVYAALVVEGYQLSYVRIPITDEKVRLLVSPQLASLVSRQP